MRREIVAYGADPTGLVCGYFFSGDGSGRPLESGDAMAWLRDPGASDGFAWLHFNLSVASAQNWLKDHLALSEVFFEALHDGAGSSRLEFADGTLVAVLNDVLYDFSFEATDISTLWVSVDRRMLVTARTKSLRSIDKLRVAVKSGETFRSSVELFVHLLRDQADVLARIVRGTISKVDDIEDRLLAERLDPKRASLGQLRRLLVRLQRLLAPEPAALFRLLSRPPQWMADSDVQELRQSTEEFSVSLSDMTALQERIKLLQEEIGARINEQNNRSLFVLTVVTVLALPINIIAGLLGMNVGGIPLAKDDDGFWIVVGIVAAFTLIAAWFAFRRRDD